MFFLIVASTLSPRLNLPVIHGWQKASEVAHLVLEQNYFTMQVLCTCKINYFIPVSIQIYIMNFRKPKFIRFCFHSLLTIVPAISGESLFFNARQTFSPLATGIGIGKIREGTPGIKRLYIKKYWHDSD